jgi:hypothetical protein
MCRVVPYVRGGEGGWLVGRCCRGRSHLSSTGLPHQPPARCPCGHTAPPPPVPTHLCRAADAATPPFAAHMPRPRRPPSPRTCGHVAPVQPQLPPAYRPVSCCTPPAPPMEASRMPPIPSICVPLVAPHSPCCPFTVHHTPRFPHMLLLPGPAPRALRLVLYCHFKLWGAMFRPGLRCRL